MLLNYFKRREISKEIEQLAFLGRSITNCLMNEPLLNAVGFKHPNPILRVFVMIFTTNKIVAHESNWL